MADAMTPADLRRLDAEVAYHLFGWRWYRHPCRGLCMLVPPDDPRWVRRSWGDSFAPEPGEWPADRFADWDRAGSDAADPRAWSMPAFSADVAAAFPVLDALRARFTNVVIHAANGWGVRCYTVDRHGEHIEGPGGSADTFPLAVCRAALAAVTAPPGA